MDKDRKRLRYRCHRRGTHEADLLLTAFAEQHLDGLDAGQLARLEALLEAPDQDLLAWVWERRPAPAEHDTDVLALLRTTRYEPGSP